MFGVALVWRLFALNVIIVCFDKGCVHAMCAGPQPQVFLYIVTSLHRTSDLYLHFILLCGTQNTVSTMLDWLQSIFIGLLACSGLFFQARDQDAGLSSLPSSKLLATSTLRWIEGMRVKYDAPGFGIGLIASPERTASNWTTEVIG